MTLKISWPYQEPFGNLSADDNEILTMYYGGMHENAVERLDSLIEAKPDRLDLILMKGHVLRQLGDSPGAVRAYNQAVKKEPDNFTANYYYALSCYMNGNFKEALKSLNLMTDDAEGKRKLFLLKGMSEIEVKNYDGAAATFKKLNEIYPDFSPYLYLLASSYEKAGDIKSACEAYVKAYKSDTSNFEILLEAAPLLLKSGDIENAYKFYKRIYEKLKDDNEIKSIYEQLSRLYRKMMAERPPAKPSASLEPRKVKAPVLENLKNAATREVLVGLNTNSKGEPLELSSIKLKSSAKFMIYNEKNRKILFTGNENNINENEYELFIKNNKFHIKNLNTARAFELGSGELYLKPVSDEDTVLFKGIKVGAGSPWESSESRYYRGGFKFVKNKGMFTVVNKVELESYLFSVLPSEMPAGFPPEALMTQAICARSEALYKKNILKKHAKHGYDLCDDQHCQMYRGVSWERPASSDAVLKTAGTVITYKGRLCDAIYSDNCGGHTQSSSEISGWGDMKYLSGASNLKGVKENKNENIFSPLFLERFVSSSGDSYCGAGGAIKNYQSRWIRKFDAEVINNSFKDLGVGDILRIIPRKRSFSGHVDSLEIIGTRGKKIIKNELKIRRLFNYSPLRSSKFIVETAYDKKGRPRFFMFIGAGFGHGVGMCQSGAYGMAIDGKNHEEIISHYFKDSSLSNLY
jgi:SpoIID/LytB domain protein